MVGVWVVVEAEARVVALLGDVVAHAPKTLDNAVTGMVLYSPPQSKGLWGGSDTLRSQKLRAEGLCP